MGALGVSTWLTPSPRDVVSDLNFVLAVLARPEDEQLLDVVWATEFGSYLGVNELSKMVSLIYEGYEVRLGVSDWVAALPVVLHIPVEHPLHGSLILKLRHL